MNAHHLISSTYLCIALLSSYTYSCEEQGDDPAEEDVRKLPAPEQEINQVPRSETGLDSTGIGARTLLLHHLLHGHRDRYRNQYVDGAYYERPPRRQYEEEDRVRERAPKGKARKYRRKAYEEDDDEDEDESNEDQPKRNKGKQRQKVIETKGVNIYADQIQEAKGEQAEEAVQQRMVEEQDDVAEQQTPDGTKENFLWKVKHQKERPNSKRVSLKPRSHKDEESQADLGRPMEDEDTPKRQVMKVRNVPKPDESASRSTGKLVPKAGENNSGTQDRGTSHLRFYKKQIMEEEREGRLGYQSNNAEPGKRPSENANVTPSKTAERDEYKYMCGDD